MSGCSFLPEFLEEGVECRLVAGGGDELGQVDGAGRAEMGGEPGMGGLGGLLHVDGDHHFSGPIRPLPLPELL